MLNKYNYYSPKTSLASTKVKFTSNDILFKGNQQDLFTLMGASDHGLQGIERLYRIGGARLFEYQYRNLINNVHQQLANASGDKTAHLQAVVSIARLINKKRPIEIEINTESGILDRIVQSNEGHVFILNHDNQRYDPSLLSAFNVLLYNKYLRSGLGESAPVPKILLNEDILTTKNQSHREVYEMLGAVGVDASLLGSSQKKRKNNRALLGVIKDFVRDENNIFIFPEGRKAIQRHLDFKDRFQSGVAEIVRLASNSKKRVSVVPLGFAFDKNKSGEESFASINIGEPVYFMREGGNLYVTPSNLTADQANAAYQKFFWGEQDDLKWVEEEGIKAKVITINGEEVKGKEQRPFIADILAENLRVSRRKAEVSLPDTKTQKGALSLTGQYAKEKLNTSKDSPL